MCNLKHIIQDFVFANLIVPTSVSANPDLASSELRLLSLQICKLKICNFSYKILNFVLWFRTTIRTKVIDVCLVRISGWKEIFWSSKFETDTVTFKDHQPSKKYFFLVYISLFMFALLPLRNASRNPRDIESRRESKKHPPRGTLSASSAIAYPHFYSFIVPTAP